MQADGEYKISKIKLVYNSFYKFKPKHIDMFEDQKIELRILSVPASPYRIDKAGIELVYGDPNGGRRTEKTESPGPYLPFTFTGDVRRYTLNIHFVQSKYTKRYVEISHWGNVYFNDEYLLHNRGAKFRGAFSTIDFNKGRRDTGKNAFRGETITLPHNAWGLFYRDDIGNISTSTVTRTVTSINSRMIKSK